MKSLLRNNFQRQSSLKPSEYQNQLNHFPKSLSTNDDSLFMYINYLISGTVKDQKNYNQYIFNHLKNTIDHQFNTLTLRNTCKFIMTLILLGNFHIYENIVKYLIPSMEIKINDQISKKQGIKTNQIKPVWQLDQFCMQTIQVLANWLPDDFLDPSKPSIFAKIKDKYKLEIADFKYFNIEKIVFCYRIIKDLGLNKIQHKCDKCESKGGDRKAKNYCRSFKKKIQQKSVVQSSLFKENKKRNNKDIVWQTGFQTLQALQQVSQQISSLSSKANEEIKIQSKHQWNPQNYETLNNKQLAQKQEKLMNKIAQVISNVKQVQQAVYHIEQKRLIQKYLKKNNIDHNIVNLKESQNKQEVLLNNRQKLISVKSMKELFSIGLIPSMDKPIIGSPIQKIKQSNILTQNTIKSSLLNNLQIFTKYLNKKSESFIRKFKIALLCSKGTIQLKKYDNGSFLKCRTYTKSNMLKVRIFNDNEPIKVQLTDSDQHIQAFEQNETQVKMIFNYGKFDSSQFKFVPISIKVDNQNIYLPVGYWNLVRQSSKSMSFIVEINQNLQSKNQSQNSQYVLCHEKQFCLNEQMFKTLNDVHEILANQFTQLKSQLNQIINNKKQIVQIKLNGQIDNIIFLIEIGKKYTSQLNQFQQSRQQKIHIRGFYHSSKENNFIKDQHQKKQHYVSALLQQLAFVLSHNQSQN